MKKSYNKSILLTSKDKLHQIDAGKAIQFDTNTLLIRFDFFRNKEYIGIENDEAYIITGKVEQYDYYKKKVEKQLRKTHRGQYEFVCFDVNMCREDNVFVEKMYRELCKILVRLKDEGYCKETGLCNCSYSILDAIVKKKEDKPAILIQDIDFKHQQLELVKKAGEMGIPVVSFTMLNGSMNTVPLIDYISEKNDTAPFYIAENWLKHYGIVPAYDSEEVFCREAWLDKQEKIKLESKEEDNKKNKEEVQRTIKRNVRYEDIKDEDYCYIEQLDDSFFFSSFPLEIISE